MPLVDTLLQLESARAMDLAWARRKFKGHYHRYLEAPGRAPPFGQRHLYMAIPADQRVISDIYEPAILGSTAGSVAANVLFDDYEVALELAGQLLTEGRLGARRGAGGRAGARYLSSR